MFQKKSMAELDRPTAGAAKAADKFPFLIILDNVRSMHNVGSVFRTADAFGAAGIFLSGYTPRPPHRDIHKTALGAEDTVAWQGFETIQQAIGEAKKAGFTIIAVEQCHDAIPLQNFKPLPHQKLALVFGNEALGVSNEALSAATQCLEIPQSGAKHSLNISVSAGVVLWELTRERF